MSANFSPQKNPSDRGGTGSDGLNEGRGRAFKGAERNDRVWKLPMVRNPSLWADDSERKNADDASLPSTIRPAQQ
jgi:hypothetical protein